jgi:DNA-binding CsgD family transcriptional regulator
VGTDVHSIAAELERARGDERALRALFDSSPFPMVMLDGERRYLDANGPAGLIFRMAGGEMRGRAVDDLAPAPELGDLWERLLDAGALKGTYDTETPDGGRFRVAYHALANVLPGIHVATFAPARWRPADPDSDGGAAAPEVPLTPRELEVLTLAARGLSGPQMAEELMLSPETVKNHFAHVRAKLGVPTRAAAVARAIQLGLID